MGEPLPAYGDNEVRTTAWTTALRRHGHYSTMHARREQHEQDERERQVAERVAERACQAAQDAEDAPLIQKLTECERCNKVHYHVQCKQWHHPKVPCDEAHLYPMPEPPMPMTDLKRYLTGTMYIAEFGAVQGDRAEWPFLDIPPVECKCLPQRHPRFCTHNSGRHVPGSHVFYEGEARRELCRRNGVEL